MTEVDPKTTRVNLGRGKQGKNRGGKRKTREAGTKARRMLRRGNRKRKTREAGIWASRPWSSAPIVEKTVARGQVAVRDRRTHLCLVATRDKRSLLAFGTMVTISNERSVSWEECARHMKKCEQEIQELKRRAAYEERFASMCEEHRSRGRIPAIHKKGSPCRKRERS